MVVRGPDIDLGVSADSAPLAGCPAALIVVPAPEQTASGDSAFLSSTGSACAVWLNYCADALILVTNGFADSSATPAPDAVARRAAGAVSEPAPPLIDVCPPPESGAA
ncbi:hypothetical protein HPB50_002269 [Hyalomma asiaticum]|uniref:Uncharacterized protein n=1 Tax=Hyalomma asiaticum TaxID=266040 RepID=A0ACB7TD23_HYAAI|nr:hypothetical protein HPB50_002269 [Hyalomma asiaticum]